MKIIVQSSLIVALMVIIGAIPPMQIPALIASVLVVAFYLAMWEGAK